MPVHQKSELLNLPRTDAELVRFIEERDPALWRFCYPRIYEEPRGCGSYYSPKSLAREIWSVISRVDAGFVDQSEATEVIWASVLQRHRYPLYWVAHDLALAVQQTVPPLTLSWEELKLPFPGLTFMLPKGLLMHDTPGERDASFVSVAYIARGTPVANIAKSGPRQLSYSDDTLLFLCFYCRRAHDGRAPAALELPATRFSPVRSAGARSDGSRVQRPALGAEVGVAQQPAHGRSRQSLYGALGTSDFRPAAAHGP